MSENFETEYVPGAAAFPRDEKAPPAPGEFVLSEGEVIGFCGYLTAELPELHGIHPQRVLDAWSGYKRARTDGFAGVFAEQHENGDGR